MANKLNENEYFKNCCEADIDRSKEELIEAITKSNDGTFIACLLFEKRLFCGGLSVR